ncbi:MAG: hypothetical protein ACUVXI_10805 [bacterium]
MVARWIGELLRRTVVRKAGRIPAEWRREIEVRRLWERRRMR